MTNLRMQLDDFRQRLTEFLQAVTGRELVVTLLQPLAGGASRDNWLVAARFNDSDTTEQYVLRRDTAALVYENALEREQEFAVMRAAFAAGARVPRPRWYCTEPCLLGAPFLVMDYVEGLSIGPQVVSAPELAGARAALPEQMGIELARIHAIDYAAAGLDFLPAPRPGFSPAQEAIAQIRAAMLNLGIHNPTLVFGLRWCEQRLPAGGDRVLLHGDFRVGNLLVGSKGLNAVTDWEASRIGDPLEDLAWPCLRDWRYGADERRLGGIGDREPFLKAYEQASGCTLDRKAVDFWEVLGNLRWATVCLLQAHRHLTGEDVSVELASLGRRSAEMQLETLRLIAEIGVFQ